MKEEQKRLRDRATQDGRAPRQCSKCGNWCLYDGWDHTHANGIGIEACTQSAPVQVSREELSNELHRMSESDQIGGRPWSFDQAAEWLLANSPLFVAPVQVSREELLELLDPSDDDRYSGRSWNGRTLHAKQAGAIADVILTLFNRKTVQGLADYAAKLPEKGEN